MRSTSRCHAPLGTLHSRSRDERLRQSWTNSGAAQKGVSIPHFAFLCDFGRDIPEATNHKIERPHAEILPPAVPATLVPGNYYLAYLPSDNNLSFAKRSAAVSTTSTSRFQFGCLPATFAANPFGSNGYHSSLWATLSPGTPVPVISPTRHIRASRPTRGARPCSRRSTDNE